MKQAFLPKARPSTPKILFKASSLLKQCLLRKPTSVKAPRCPLDEVCVVLKTPQHSDVHPPREKCKKLALGLFESKLLL